MDLPVLPTYLFNLQTWQGWVSLALTIVLPILIGLLTRPTTPGHVKGLGLLALSALKGVGEAFLIGGAEFNLGLVASTALVNFLIAVAMYFGILRGSPVQVSAQNSGVK